MRQTGALLLAAALAATPLAAQEAEDEGLSLMERGAEMFLRGLIDEARPALDEFRDLAEGMEPALRQFADEMGPAFAELMQRIDSLSHYAPPEILPNGDIIIRRKPDAPLLAPPDAPDEIEI